MACFGFNEIAASRDLIGGLQVDHAKRLQELEPENAEPKRLVVNLSLDNLVLKDFASET